MIEVGSTYLLNSFFFLKGHGILSQHSAPGTLQQNGVVERKNRTLLDMVRSMMSFSILPLGICPRDSNLHSECGVIQVSTKDTHGNVDMSKT